MQPGKYSDPALADLEGSFGLCLTMGQYEMEGQSLGLIEKVGAFEGRNYGSPDYTVSLGDPQPHSGDTRLSPSVTTHKDTCLPAPALGMVFHLDRLRVISCYCRLPSGMGSTGFPLNAD